MIRVNYRTQWRRVMGRGTIVPGRRAEGAKSVTKCILRVFFLICNVFHCQTRTKTFEQLIDNHVVQNDWTFLLWESQIGTFPNKTWPLVRFLIFHFYNTKTKTNFFQLNVLQPCFQCSAQNYTLTRFHYYVRSNKTRVRFLWEWLGTAFTHLFCPWECCSHTYLNVNKAQDGFGDFVDSKEGKQYRLICRM